MRRDGIAEQACSVARAAAVVGDPWSLLIIREAFFGNRRFADFVELTGAQPSVVSNRLKRLVDASIFERREYQQHPPRQEYRLTTMGKGLQPVVIALARWGDTHLDEGRGAPLVHVHSDCGHPADPRFVCGHCSEPLTNDNVRVRPGPGADPSDLERRRNRAA